MKIQQVGDEQIEIKDSGMPSIIVGVIMIVVGIGVAIAPIFAALEWWFYIIAAVFACAGLLVLAFAKSKHIILRKNATSEVTQTNIISKKATHESFEHDQISSVILETSVNHTGSNQNNPNYGQPNRQSDPNASNRVRKSILLIELNDTRQIIIASKQSNNSGVSVNGINLGSFSVAPLYEEARQIADFLDVPLNNRDSSRAL